MQGSIFFDDSEEEKVAMFYGVSILLWILIKTVLVCWDGEIMIYLETTMLEKMYLFYYLAFLFVGMYNNHCGVLKKMLSYQWVRHVFLIPYISLAIPEIVLKWLEKLLFWICCNDQ